jgi:hypothetical protein
MIGNYLCPSIKNLELQVLCVQALLCFDGMIHFPRLELKRGDSSTKRVSFSQVSQATNTLQNSLLSLIFKYTIMTWKNKKGKHY